MDAIIKKLTAADISAINSEGLNGAHLVEYGYYKITLKENSQIYCYTRDFGGLDPDQIAPYLYIEKSIICGDILRIDIAAIKNDEARNPIKIIPIQFIENINGENAKIFKGLENGRYYMRVSSYPRENFARWVTTYKSGGRWEDGATIRANIIFDFNGEREKVTASNWNGCAVYNNNFNINFEGVKK